MAMPPTVSELRNLKAMSSRMPMMAAMGASVEGLNTSSQAAPVELMSRRRMICPVTVVPTFAPMMIPSDWCSVMSPAPTSPEVNTIVAVELWMTAVTRRPQEKADERIVRDLFHGFFKRPEDPPA